MAVFEQSGLTELIDSRFRIDKRRILTPGNSVKALLGALSDGRGKRPLYRVADFYASAPVDLLFGDKVTVQGLGDRAFARNLDLLFGIDLGELAHDCYGRLCGRYGLSSDIYNIDTTNFTITSLGKEADRPGASTPGRCGHAKDGHNERLVYSLLSITDGNGIICYERPYDGATTDGEMDRDAVEYMSGKTDPRSTTLIADCKIVTGPLIGRMCDLGFGFVSKCPENFGNRIRADIEYSVVKGVMTPSGVRGGWEVYDTDAEVGGRNLRFIAYRTADDIGTGVEFHRSNDLKEAETWFSRVRSLRFNCEEDARRAISEAGSHLADNAYAAVCDIVPVETRVPYGRRGRPPKDSIPEFRTEYAVEVELVFDEAKATRLSQDRNVRVLVTNLPRATEDAENVRFGATADTLLLSYLGQYRIEHTFRLMKSGFGMSSVYLHRPSRSDAMSFVLTMCTMVSETVSAVLKRAGAGITMESMVETAQSLVLKYDRARGEESFEGDHRLSDGLVAWAGMLDVDLDRLFR